MSSAGCTLVAGQPVMRTVPPVTTAAARNGTALDRSGSTSQCRAATAPGAHLPAVGHRVVDVDAGLPQHHDRHRDVRRRRHRAPVCCDGQALGERRAGQQQARDELRRRRRVDCHGAAGHRSGAVHPERQPVPSIATPRPRSASSSGAMGRARACSSPSNDHRVGQRGQRRNEPQHRAGQAAVHSGVAAGVDAAADRQVRCRSRRPAGPGRSARRSSGRCRGCAAPRRCVEVPWPCAAASPASTSARLVCDFEPGTVTVACTGAVRDVGPPGLGAHRFILPCRRVSWVPGTMEDVWTVCGHDGSGPAGREDQGDRRSHRCRRATRPQPNYNVAPTTTVARWSPGTASPTTSRPAGCG